VKEVRFFYCPDAATTNELPKEEAQHATKVLRLNSGDEIFLMDGKGCFYKAQITLASNKHCLYEITERLPQEKTWTGNISLAIAPTKNIDRIEWLAEKATEIGFDRLAFLDCQFSERRQIRTDRIEKIVVAAVKQSRKPYMTQIDELTPFKQFVDNIPTGTACFIAHCYDEVPRTYLLDELKQLPKQTDTMVFVGPEGDFSIDEVNYAISHGFKSISLGKSRLRTETAGLMAVTMQQLTKTI
jgi:16S rRNA (uracil1498-N3)-methyltransferase